MRIGVDAHLLERGKDKIERMVHEILKDLSAHMPKDEFSAFVDARFICRASASLYQLLAKKDRISLL